MMKQKKQTAHDAAMKAVAHTTACELDAAVSDAIDVIGTIGINVGLYSLVALAYIAGTAAGKHLDRERRKLPTVHRWNFIDTKAGRTLYRSCVESGDFAPYSKARARYALEADAIEGLKPPAHRVDRPDPVSTYREVIDRDLPRLSARVMDLSQRLAMLNDALKDMALREEVKAELLEAETT